MLFASFATLWPGRVESCVLLDIDPTTKPQSQNIASVLIPLLNEVLEKIRNEQVDGLEQARKRASEVISKLIEDENVRHRMASSLVIRDGKIDWR